MSAAKSQSGRTADPRDPLGLSEHAPLFRAYLAGLDRRSEGERSFTTPGHKGRSLLTGTSVAGDLGLSGGVDTVKFAHGYLGQAEALAAEAFGAEICRFSVGGSTHGNQTLALSVGEPGDRVIVSRTLHRSMLIGLVLSGLVPLWVRPKIDQATGLPKGVDPSEVARLLKAEPETKAVFIGEPSYVGTFSEVSRHAEVAHDGGVPLVLDAAWAAHFGFHPELPVNAMKAGADAMVTSAHKVLPAYSQGAIILAGSERIDPARLDRGFEATYTTSPSGQILASIDAARALMQFHGEELVGRMLANVAAARERLKEVEGLVVVEGDGVDPAKLVVVVSRTGAHGVEVEREMIERGMPLEMADRDTLVALVTVADSSADVEALVEALSASIKRHRGTPREISAAASWAVEAEYVVSPREAFFAPAERVALDEAVGRVSAELVAPYPPGVPVLAPGERVSAETLAALREARAEGVRIAYAADPSLESIEVLARR